MIDEPLSDDDLAHATAREQTPDPFCCLERDQYGECGHVQPDARSGRYQAMEDKT